MFDFIICNDFHFLNGWILFISYGSRKLKEEFHFCYIRHRTSSVPLSLKYFPYINYDKISFLQLRREYSRWNKKSSVAFNLFPFWKVLIEFGDFSVIKEFFLTYSILSAHDAIYDRLCCENVAASRFKREIY